MIRFLHISDVHLNKTFSSKNKELREKLARSVIISFKNAISFCIQNKVDALLIAGDLFDDNTVSLKHKRLVIDSFEELNKYGIKVYYASGNHDFTSYTSDVRNIKYPENVHMFCDDKYSKYDLIDRDTDEKYHIIGCGHIKKHETENLISTFPVKNDTMTIGIAHSMVNSRLTIGDEGDYLPSTVKEISSKKYDYFALGHIHQNGSLDKDNKIYYSGVLQGLSSKETGEKGGYLVNLDKDGLDVQFIELSSMKWISIGLELNESIDSIDTLYESIISKIKTDCDSYIFSNLSIEIKLFGKTKLFRTIKSEKTIDEISELIAEHFDLFDFKLNIKNVKSQYEKLDYIGKKSVLGKVLEDIDVIKTNKENIKLDFLNVCDDEYLSELLQDMDDEIMDYFLEDNNEN